MGYIIVGILILLLVTGIVGMILEIDWLVWTVAAIVGLGAVIGGFILIVIGILGGNGW